MGVGRGGGLGERRRGGGLRDDFEEVGAVCLGKVLLFLLFLLGVAICFRLFLVRRCFWENWSTKAVAVGDCFTCYVFFWSSEIDEEDDDADDEEICGMVCQLYTVVPAVRSIESLPGSLQGIMSSDQEHSIHACVRRIGHLDSFNAIRCDNSHKYCDSV